MGEHYEAEKKVQDSIKKYTKGVDRRGLYWKAQMS